MTPKQKKLLTRIIVSAILLVPLVLIYSEVIPLQLNRWAMLCLFLIPYLIVGGDVLKKAWKGIAAGQVFSEHFLMAVATISALVIGEYEEAVAVMLFYQVGELFQDVAVSKSRRNISALMDIRPDYANIEVDGKIEKVDPDDVEIGSIIVVQPGEKVPLDGVITEGRTALDESALTGESRPVDVESGDEVLSGSINTQGGVIRIRTTKEFGESTASKILDLVENAASRKAASENFIAKFARYYTPIVCYAALALAVIPPVVALATGVGMAGYASAGALWSDWVLRGCTFLVVSCPCAFVISIPLSFFAGLGGASSAGILIKGSNYIETLSKVKTVAFDKTGTVTKGNFVVTAVHHSRMADEELLRLAAYAESYSTHPISLSLRQAYGKAIDRNRVRDVKEISGHGVTAVVDDAVVSVGNEKMMRDVGAEPISCHEHATIVHVAVNGEYAGHIVISDEIKPTAAEAIRELNQCGVKKTVMLTGDRKETAESVASSLGISEYRAELLPADKVSSVEALLAEDHPKEKLAFVGDGINDAPVLARADVGIAMGALGSDAAIEAADVVLMDDDPVKIAKAIRIARKCMRVVMENIVFALAVKLLCLVLAAVGIANMWVAVLADVGVMIIAVLNAIRCLSVRKV